MKYALIVLFFCFNSILLIGQNTIDYQKSIEFSSKIFTFQDLINSVSEKTSIEFSFSSAVIEPKSSVVLEKTNYSLQQLLDELSVKLQISYIEFRGKILFVEKSKEFNEYWFYGFLRDASSGEALIGASIYNFKDKTGVVSNEFGYFSLKIVSPNPRIKISFIGYESIDTQAINPRNPRVDFNLIPIFRIPEIVVTPTDSFVHKLIIEKIFDETTSRINPGLLGEKDVLQSLKFLPGMQSGSEVQGNILVRGGGTDQNLILMDGVPLYEVNHLLGLTSIFSEDAVNDVDFYNSDFSSKYGGRLSSVINIQIKDGNKLKHKSTSSIGLLGAKFHLEGPIVKETTSFNLSLRTSFINLLVKPIAKQYLDVKLTDFGFSDLNLKLHHKLTKNNSISISTYQGIDNVGFSNDTKSQINPELISLQSSNNITWKNSIVSFRFNHLINQKLFFNIAASTVNYTLSSRSSNLYTNYIDDSIELEQLDVFATSVISDRNLRTDWEYSLDNDHKVIFGGGITNHIYNPAVISKNVIEEGFSPNLAIGISASERFIYLEDNIDLSSQLNITAGFHYSQFSVENEQFASFQPRIKLSYFINQKNDFTLSYSKMTQYIHMLVNPGTGLPSNLLLPSTKIIPPEESIQYNFRYNRVWSKKFISFISVYYKELSNLIEYRSAFPLYNPIINGKAIVPIFNNSRDWEDRIEIGKGEAYGADFFTSFENENWDLSFSYSYGRSFRQFELINKGLPFPFKYDRRHDLSISGSYNINKKMRFGLNWVYGSGHATTFGTTQFRDIDGNVIIDYSNRNNFRLPAFHRLDINVNYNLKLNSKMNMDFTAGIYNAYNRLNPYYVYLYNDPVTDIYSARQVGIFPILPFFNVRLKY